MKDFKDESVAWRQKFDQESKAFKEEMKSFREEMKDFKDESVAWRQKFDQESKEMRRQWAKLADKIGGITENIIAGGIVECVKRTYGLDVHTIIQRVIRKIAKGKEREYDVLVVCEGYVFVVESKGTFRPQEFPYIQEAMKKFPEFFPEYRHLKMVPVVASLILPEEIVNRATKLGFLALNLSGDYLEFVNADRVQIE